MNREMIDILDSMTVKDRLGNTMETITGLIEDARLNNMEIALLQDARDLIGKIQKYPLAFGMPEA